MYVSPSSLQFHYLGFLILGCWFSEWESRNQAVFKFLVKVVENNQIKRIPQVIQNARK